MPYGLPKGISKHDSQMVYTYAEKTAKTPNIKIHMFESTY